MIGKILNFKGLKFDVRWGRVAVFVALSVLAGGVVLVPGLSWAQTVPSVAEPQRLDKRFEQPKVPGSVMEPEVPETKSYKPSKDLKKIYSSLLKDAPKNGKLFCRKKDKSLFKGITKLSQSGEITDLGFIIESGDYRLDYRFSTLVEGQWQENLPMVSEALFAE